MANYPTDAPVPEEANHATCITFASAESRDGFVDRLLMNAEDRRAAVRRLDENDRKLKELGRDIDAITQLVEEALRKKGKAVPPRP